MGKGHTVRLFTSIALVASTSSAVCAAGGPASAAKPRPSCSVLVGTFRIRGITSRLSGCTPAGDTGGNSAVVSQAGNKGSKWFSTVTWAGKHGVTTATYDITPRTKNPKCGTSLVKGKKTNNLEIVETGKVLTSTGPASKDIKVGDATSATLCVNAATSAESLLKGTKFVF